MAIEATIKRWGNSGGIIVPREIMKKEHLKFNEKVLVDFVKEANLNDVFGTLKTKTSGQKFKDMVRQGWQP